MSHSYAILQLLDIITYDTNGIGSWDHIGYVTDRKTTEANHGGKTYVNYKVAQHSTNYHKWASDTGWPNRATGTVYGRVRR